MSRWGWFWGEVDFLWKSLRGLISIVAWTWALLVFSLGYFGRGGGDYNHIANTHEVGPPPLFTSVIIPVLKVLVVAPSGALGDFIAPGTAGVHASVQAFPGSGPSGSNLGGYGALGRAGGGEQQESWALPQPQQQQQQQSNGVQWCAGCLPGMMTESRSDSSWGNERRRDFQSVQQQLQPDGQYSFSYSGGDSSRQEQRNLDGTVVGSYAFTDPEGQAVRVEYRAAPNQGFSAFPTYGREMVPSSVGTGAGGGYPSPYAGPVGGPSQFNVLPTPPQETPEVLAARAQFFRAYDQQLQLVKSGQEAAARAQQAAGNNNQVVSVYSGNAQQSQQQQQSNNNNNVGQQQDGQSGQNPLDYKNLPEPIAVPDGNQVAGEAVDDEDNEGDNNKDAIVISADDEDSGSIPRPSSLSNKRPPLVPQLPQLLRQPTQGQQQQQTQPQQFSQQPLVQPSYSFSTLLGNQPQFIPQGIPANQQQQQQPVLGLQNFPAIPSAPFQQQQQSQPQQQTSQLKGGLEPYFYYVSVGGQPHYVTSNNMMRSDYPTSLKAQQVGAAPIAPRHDAQIPFNAKDGQTLSRSSPPLYLDFDLSKTFQQSKESGVPGIIYGFVPSALNANNQQFAPPQSESLSQFGGQQGQQMINSNNNNNLPFVGYPVFYVNKK